MKRPNLYPEAQRIRKLATGEKQELKNKKTKINTKNKNKKKVQNKTKRNKKQKGVQIIKTNSCSGQISLKVNYFCVYL